MIRKEQKNKSCVIVRPPRRSAWRLGGRNHCAAGRSPNLSPRLAAARGTGQRSSSGSGDGGGRAFSSAGARRLGRLDPVRAGAALRFLICRAKAAAWRSGFGRRGDNAG